MPALFPWLLLASALLLSVPLVLGFLGRLHPAFDSFAHFRAHLAVLMGLLAFPLLFTAFSREAIIILLFALTAFATTLGLTQGLLSGARAQAASGQEPTYSLLQLNLRYDHREPAELLRLVAREKPDIITLEEASAQWEPTLKLLEARYPYRQHCRKGSDTWGVSILSRRPFAEGSESGCSGDGIMTFARFDLGGAPVTVVALHLAWPWPYGQADEIALIEPHLARLDGPLLIAGDFNAVAWSKSVRRIETASGARHIAGIRPSFAPLSFPAGLTRYIGLPIDQILASPGVRLAKIATLGPVGSDHLPVRLDFSVSQPPREGQNDAQIVMN